MMPSAHHYLNVFLSEPVTLIKNARRMRGHEVYQLSRLLSWTNPPEVRVAQGGRHTRRQDSGLHVVMI